MSYSKLGEGHTYSTSGRKSTWIDDSPFIKLEPGNYVIRVKVFWRNNKSESFTLSSYSDNPIELAKIERISYKNFLNKWIMDSANEYSLKDKGKGCKIGGGFLKYSYYGMYLENNGNTDWTVKIKFTELKNMRLGKTYRTASDEFALTVPAHEKRCTYLKTTGSMYSVLWEVVSSWS